jgi:hypothetical protein
MRAGVRSQQAYESMPSSITELLVRSRDGTGPSRSGALQELYSLL